MLPTRPAAPSRDPAPWLWGLAGAAVCASVISFEPSLLEEGALLHTAQRLVHGEQLYRDVVAFTGPLPFQVLAALFQLFGEEIAVGRVAVALLHGATTGASVVLAGRRSPWAHVAGAAMASAPILLFPLFSIYYYTTLALHASVLAALCALRGLGSSRWAAASGVLVVAAGLCKQTLGAALAPLLLLVLLVSSPREQRRARALAFAAGAAGLLAIELASFALEGSLQDLFRGVVIIPLSLEESFRLPYMNLWPPGQLAPAIRNEQTFYLPYYYILVHGVYVVPGWRITLASQLLYALPFAAIAAALVHLIRGRLAPSGLVTFALLLAWITNLFPRSDWGHLGHVLPLAVVQLAGLGGGAATAPRLRRSVRWLAVGLVSAGLGAGAWAGRAFLARSAGPPNQLGPRVSLRAVSPVLGDASVARVVQFLRANAVPGEAIYVPRAEPLLYFATETRNPTPYPGIIPAARDEQERVILAALEGVRFVVMSDVDQPAMSYYAEALPAVQAHLERYFHVPFQFQFVESWLVPLQRGADRGATLVDLNAERDRARAWIRDGDGSEHPAALFTDRLRTRRNRRPLPFHLGAGGGGLDFDLVVPEDAVFQGDVGFWRIDGLNQVHEHPPGATLRLRIRGDGEFETLAEAPTAPFVWPGRGWTPVEADLSRYARQRVTLRLELVPGPILAAGQIGYWGSPRLARRIASPPPAP